MGKLYLVGKTIKRTPDGVIWEFFGIFTSHEKALKACTEKNLFLGLVTMNERAPDETTDFPNCVYPLMD